jgi:type I restriction enzyme S subunit
MSKVRFESIVSSNAGFLRGPFGGDLKKEIFIPKAADTYKVYEQGVVLNRDHRIGRYYISNDYFHQKMQRFEVKKNDFLVSCSGVNYGAIYQLTDDIEPGIINQALLRIRLDNTKILDDYFLYLFKSHIVNMIVGRKGDSTIPNFPPLQVIKKLEFNLPVLDIQAKVGSILKNIDAKIEVNNSINKELELMAKTLFEYWFVQFDFPDANGKPYKTSGGKMVHTPILKREIPEGFSVKALSEISNITMGQSPNGSSYNEKGQGVIFFQGSTDFGWLFPTTRQYTTEPARMAKQGDILLSVRAPVGDMNVAIDDCCIGRGLAALNSKSGYDGFLFYVMKYFKQVFDRRNSEGTTFGSITKDDLFSLQLAYPNDAVLKRYDTIVSSYNKMILKRSLENQQLINLRDWLLPMLMNGQVNVR